MAGLGLVRLAALLGVLGVGLYGAASVYGRGEGGPRAAAEVQPEATRADSAQTHALPAAVRRLADSPVDGPLRPVVLGEAQPVPEVVIPLPMAGPAMEIRRVQVSGANVRSGPSTGFGVVGRVGQGEEVEVVESAGNGWVRIRIQGDGIDGWMAERLLAR